MFSVGIGKYGSGYGGGLEKGNIGRRTIIIIIAHDNLLNLSEFAHLAPEILVKSIKVVLQLRGVHLVLGVVGRVLVEVG